MRYSDILVVLSAFLAGAGYFFWTQPQKTIGEQRVSQVAISSSGKWYAAGSIAGHFAVWPQAKPDKAQHFQIENGTPRALVFSPDEKYVIIAHLGGLSVQSVQELRAPRVLKAGVGFRAVAFPPEGKRFLALTDAGSAEWWDYESGEMQPEECCGAPDGVLAFSPHGNFIAASGSHPVLWDAHTGKKVTELTGDGGHAGIGPIAFDDARRQILMGSRDGRVYAWDWPSGVLRGKSPEPAGAVDSVAVLRQSRWIVFAKTSAPLHLWNPDTGDMRSLEALPYSNVVAGPQPASVLFGNYAGSVELWNAETGAVLSRFTLR